MTDISIPPNVIALVARLFERAGEIIMPQD
jgi:hypothetical protein